MAVDNTSDEYLQDSYNYVFQRHVDNLNTVISQHMVKTSPDKAKTHVHIHPTSGNEPVVEPPKSDRKNSPKNKKKALTKLDIKSASDLDKHELKSVSFVDEELIDEKDQAETPNEMNVITEKLQEANFFEELNNNENADPKPMIVFNHVSTEMKSEQISFELIHKSGSRSPSPLLEVPSFKEAEKEIMRPPL